MAKRAKTAWARALESAAKHSFAAARKRALKGWRTRRRKKRERERERAAVRAGVVETELSPAELEWRQHEAAGDHPEDWYEAYLDDYGEDLDLDAHGLFEAAFHYAPEPSF